MERSGPVLLECGRLQLRLGLPRGFLCLWVQALPRLSQFPKPPCLHASFQPLPSQYLSLLVLLLLGTSGAPEDSLVEGLSPCLSFLAFSLLWPPASPLAGRVPTLLEPEAAGQLPWARSNLKLISSLGGHGETVASFGRKDCVKGHGF